MAAHDSLLTRAIAHHAILDATSPCRALCLISIFRASSRTSCRMEVCAARRSSPLAQNGIISNGARAMRVTQAPLQKHRVLRLATFTLCLSRLLSALFLAPLPFHLIATHSHHFPLHAVRGIITRQYSASYSLCALITPLRLSFRHPRTSLTRALLHICFSHLFALHHLTLFAPQ